ncbi:mitochondrial ribosomal protein L37-domain-containing protein [Abortiporus biennis]|nr:mitochondrial ribosomal protein L37-domain-containing protein [Abortiporus biennis]
MSFLRLLPRQSLRVSQSCCWNAQRSYAVKAKDTKDASSAPVEPTPSKPSAESKSSCPENTVLTGLNWLKGQPNVVALPDDAYPPWLWKLLEPKVLPDDGPGGQGEKYKMRKQRRQGIRDRNFMLTQ